MLPKSRNDSKMSALAVPELIAVEPCDGLVVLHTPAMALQEISKWDM